MYSPDETVVYRARDDYGEVVVTDSTLLRTLYFGNFNKQSSMYIQHASILVLEYTIAMQLSLLFTQSPRRILIVGMGGGSLCKFLLRHCPKARIDVVELRSLVIDISHDFFQVPRGHERLSVIESDAGQFIELSDQFYDLILIDAFDADGPASSLLNSVFLNHCRERLSPEGVLCLNLWNRRQDGFAKFVSLMQQVFNQPVAQYHVNPVNSNVLVFGFVSVPRWKRDNAVSALINQFAATTGIDLTNYYRSFKKQNSPFWRRLLSA